MRQTIKALGWIIAILWIAVLLLPATVALSILQLMEGQNFGIQEPTFTVSPEGNFTMSMPVYVNNTGFYDLSEITVTIKITKENRTISTLATTLPDVPARTMASSNCTISSSLAELFAQDRELLTNTATLIMRATLHFRVAYAIAFNGTMNFPVDWGAPFNNLDINVINYNLTSGTVSVSINFDNDAYFDLSGPLLIKLYNAEEELISSSQMNLNISSQTHFQDLFEMTVSDPSKMSNSGSIRLYFLDMEIFEGGWILP